jgi:hypothetical protein
LTAHSKSSPSMLANPEKYFPSSHGKEGTH